MSIEIFYDKIFIKAGDFVLPLFLNGSSNCTMVVGKREVLERSWNVQSPLKKLCVTPEELLNEVKTKWNVDSEFGRWRGKNITGKDMVKIYERGVKSLVSVEEATALNGRLVCNIHIYKGSDYSKKPTVYVNNTADLLTWMHEFDDLALKAEKDTSVYASVGFKDVLKPLRKPSKVTGPVIAKGRGAYVTEYKPKASVTFGPLKDAIVFDSVGKAKEELGDFWKIRYISAKNKNKVKRPQWVLKCDLRSFRDWDLYVKRKSSKALFFAASASTARKFDSKNAARKYKEMIEPIYTDCSFTIEEYV